MYEQNIRIKINNITPTHRAVYRALRTRMGLQRQEANFAMLGYIMADEAHRLPLLSIINLAETIYKKADAYTNPELDKLVHEWQHVIAHYTEAMKTNQITVTEQ